MFDMILGYLLYFIGINKTLPMVKGDTTDLIATSSATTSGNTKLWKITRKVKNATEAAYLVSLLKTRNADMNAKWEKIQEEAIARWKTKDAEFQKRLAAVKSEKKIATATRIQQGLVQTNASRTKTMKKHLETMGEILDKVASKTSALTGKDTGSLNNAIASAQQSIQDALDAVETQAAKTYSITITTGETTLKADVEATRKGLETDLKAVHEKIKTARAAVETAIKELRKFLPWRNGKEVPEIKSTSKPASPSATPKTSVTATPMTTQ